MLAKIERSTERCYEVTGRFAKEVALVKDSSSEGQALKRFDAKSIAFIPITGARRVGKYAENKQRRKLP